jgi:ribosome-binding factor A
MIKKRRGFKRTDRVGQQLYEFLAIALMSDLEDPLLAQVQLMHVDVSPDLRYARIYYILFDQSEPSVEVQKALERVKGMLKREIGAQLQMRYIPDLVFVYDESVERGRRMDELLSELKKD